LLAYFSLLPNTSSIQRLIAEADTVSIELSITTDPAGAVKVAEAKNPSDRRLLASSLRLVGAWVPIDVLIANGCRIRIFKDGDFQELLIRGGLMHFGPVWRARIDPDFFRVVRQLASDQSQPWPSIELLRAKAQGRPDKDWQPDKIGSRRKPEKSVDRKPENRIRTGGKPDKDRHNP
jgi:hypothetical protein